MTKVLFNTHDLVLLITIYQCLLFSFFLLTLKKGKKQSNILLALFLLSHAAIPMDILVSFGAAFRQFAIQLSPNLFHFFKNAYWLEAPLLLFYIRSLIYKDFTLRKVDFIYFLPFCVSFMDYLVNWVFEDNLVKLNILNSYQVAQDSLFQRMSYLFREAFRLFCGILCFTELTNYRKQIKNELADIEDVDLTWLKILTIGFLVIFADAVLTSLAIISSFELHVYIDFEFLGLFANYTTLFLISFLIFFSLGYSNVFKGIETEPEPTPQPEESPIDPVQVDTVERYMEEQKPYLNHLLSLDNLSNQLKMSPRNLSQLINRHFKKNFFEFINGYRISESKALLLDEKNRKVTMLDIMDKAGFNSKATFNTLFKKQVGMTPTQYRKENINKEET